MTLLAQPKKKFGAEDKFTDELLSALKLELRGCKVERKISILYDLAVSEDGFIRAGVDPDSGLPIRGGGKGFEQDILVYQEVRGGNTSVVPRIVAEVKFNQVTTHDAIVYSEKARRIRRVYPYVRYGMIIGGFSYLPRRVLRLAADMDFLCVVSESPRADELACLRKLFKSELRTSLRISGLLAGKGRTTLVHRATYFAR